MKLLYTDNIIHDCNDVRRISKDAMQQNFGRLGEMDKINLIHMPRTKNRFAHVFWSKPTLLTHSDARWGIGNQYELTLALSALSLACLKGFRQEVVLYTDSKGKELLQDLGYDRIYNIFDNLNVPNDFWAAGKIMALQNEPLDSCIIDNDLFLYDGTLIDKIAETEILSSHLENTAAYKPMISTGQKYFKHLCGANEYSSNTGVMKISDFRLKQMFISAYFSCMHQLSTPDVLQKLKDIGKGAYCPDLLCEQFNFHKICRPQHLIEKPKQNTDVRGFTHLISFEKYLKIPMVLDILKTSFPEYYDKVLNKWVCLDFQVEVED